jgi:hypothetical protein
VEGQNQSVYKRGLTKESIRLAVTVEKRLVMIKELVRVNQFKMDRDRELETVKFIHYQTQHHQYEIDTTDKAHNVDEVKKPKKLLRIHCQIHCQMAQ